MQAYLVCQDKMACPAKTAILVCLVCLELKEISDVVCLEILVRLALTALKVILASLDYLVCLDPRARWVCLAFVEKKEPLEGLEILVYLVSLE